MIYEKGISSVMTTINNVMELEEALERAEELFKSSADRMFRMIKVGYELSSS